MTWEDSPVIMADMTTESPSNPEHLLQSILSGCARLVGKLDERST